MGIISTILGVESGGRNVTQSLGTADINNNFGAGGGDPAQGAFQITNGTWAQFGGLATGYTSANQAPYAVQLAIAQNIPIARWGPDTQAALASQGYTFTKGETLGQALNNNGEVASTTAPAAFGNTASGSNVGDPFEDIGSSADDSGVGPNSDPLGSSVTLAQPPSIATGSAGSVDFNDIGDDTFDGAADPAAVASGAGGALGAGIAGGGIAVDLTDPANVAINAGKDIQAGAGTVGKDVQTSAGGIAGTAASILNSFETYTSRAFVVIALVLLGALFIAFGLGMFGKREAAAA